MSTEEDKNQAIEAAVDLAYYQGYSSFPTTDGRVFIFKRLYLQEILDKTAESKEDKVIILCKDIAHQPPQN